MSSSIHRIILLALFIHCFAAKPVFAQGMPMFTNPIGSKQLMKYADRLELTIDQQIALEPMHDSYLQIYRALRDKDMQEFIDILYNTMSDFMLNGFAIPKRDNLEKIIREYQKVENKINAIDKSFFNEIGSLLDENQYIHLQRVTKQRKLDVLRTIIMEIGGNFNKGASVDLTQYVEALDLSDEEKAVVNPILISYESTLLAKAQKLHKAVKNAAISFLDAIDELGLRDLQTEELMQLGNDEQFQLSVQEIFDEASIEFQKAAFELSQLNLKTLRKLFQFLESQNKNDLRDKYYQRVYWKAYSGTNAWRMRFNDALKLATLSDELKEAITQRRISLKIQQDVIIEKLVNTIEKSREYRSMEALDRSGEGKYDQEIEDLQVISGGMAKKAIEDLEAMLGPEFMTELRHEKETRNKQAIVERNIKNDEVVSQKELAIGVSSQADRQQKDKHLPDPVSPSEYKHYTSMLQFETEDQFIVDILYQEYRDNYDKVLYEPLHDSSQDDESQQSNETQNAANIAETRQLRIDDLQEIDKRMFDDIALIIKSEQQIETHQRLYLLRTRTNYRKLSQTYSPGWRNRQAVIDLVYLLMNSQIEGLKFTDLSTIFESYESQTLKLLINRFELAKKLQKRMESWSRASEAKVSPAVSQRMMKSWQELQKDLSKNSLYLSEINEEHLDLIKTQLPANTAQQLQNSYYETIYPEMYRDSRNINKTINAALSMPNISTSQLSQLNGIANNFQNKYMKLVEQSIKLQRELDNDRSNFSMGLPSHEMLMHELESERLEYDREEACQRAMMQLQRTLGKTQQKALQEISKWQ